MFNYLSKFSYLFLLITSLFCCQLSAMQCQPVLESGCWQTPKVEDLPDHIKDLMRRSPEKIQEVLKEIQNISPDSSPKKPSPTKLTPEKIGRRMLDSNTSTAKRKLTY